MRSSAHNIGNLLVALGATISAVHAEQVFSNTGTTDGWGELFTEHHGTISQVDNIYYSGVTDKTALKFTQEYDPSYSKRYHSEARLFDVYVEGDEGYYGFAFRLSEKWEFEPAQGYNLAQFIADFGGLDCGEDFMPSSMVWVDGDQLGTRVKFGEVCGGQESTYFESLATVTAGEWHSVVIHSLWSSDASKGVYELWFDGEQVLSEKGIATTVSNEGAFEFRVGLYANSWYDEGYKGNQPFRQVWMDQIAYGSEFDDADPAEW